MSAADDDAPLRGFALLAELGILRAPGTTAREKAAADKAAAAGEREIRYYAREHAPGGVPKQRPFAEPAAGIRPAAGIDLSAWRLDSITAGDPPPQRFLLEPLFPLGTAGVLFGPGGVGKSMLALDLCLAVACRALMPDGGLGFAAGPLGCCVPAEAGGAAIFVTLEDSKDEIHRRTTALDPTGSRHGAPVFVIPGIELPGFDPVLVAERGRVIALTEFATSGLTQLLDNVADACIYSPKLLVLDPAGDFLEGEENSAAVVKPLMRRMREVAREYDCTIVLIGHVSKSSDPGVPTMRGSSAWIANSRFAYSLSPPIAAKGARTSQDDGGAGNLVFGELIKANHAGAPVGRRKPFQRDATTGRLLDASRLIARQEVSEGDLLSALILACVEAEKAGTAFTVSNKRGLYERREELPEILATLPRQRLRDLGKLAVNDGWLAQDAEGNLGAPED